jgi:hypothetical protein
MLGFIGHLVVSDSTPQLAVESVTSATTRGLGSVTRLVSAPDSLTARLVGPDTMTVAFNTPAPVDSLSRSYFLRIEATPVNPRTLQTARLRPVGETGRLQFSLDQNAPNPFARTTTIHFTLPTASQVRMEVFDLMGRHVRTLAVGMYEAGGHAVEWDQRDLSGNRMRAGVYLYRLVAGRNRALRKMVLLAD